MAAADAVSRAADRPAVPRRHPAAHQWIWDQPYDPHPDYGFFKGQWYAQMDPRFADFFPRRVFSTIRLDEIDWGGVDVNGIPPLEYPAHLPAGEADYLDDDHVVFGVAAGARPAPIRSGSWPGTRWRSIGWAASS